jgi:ParB family chromosome partitioning protein
MTSPKIELIPIAEIRIVNPRTRNRKTFQNITANIAKVGLKKPVTVCPRALEADGTRYDLVCGQGRLESVRELGDAMIPAIISGATEEQRYLMSLVENLARRPPSTSELLREVKRLNLERLSAPAIAERLGLDRTYIYGVLQLLRHGEESLIERVEAGRLPIDVAVTIAAGKDSAIQNALSEAYESGVLRGGKLRAVQQLINQRKGTPILKSGSQPLTAADLIRTYEQHTQEQRALVRRSVIVTERLAALKSSLRRLNSDENFLTLLRAEGIRPFPEALMAQSVPSGEAR